MVRELTEEYFSGIPGTDNEFYVDTTKAGDGDLKITIEGPDGTSPAPEVTKITEHHYKVGGAVKRVAFV